MNVIIEWLSFMIVIIVCLLSRPEQVKYKMIRERDSEKGETDGGERERAIISQLVMCKCTLLLTQIITHIIIWKHWALVCTLYVYSLLSVHILIVIQLVSRHNYYYKHKKYNWFKSPPINYDNSGSSILMAVLQLCIPPAMKASISSWLQLDVTYVEVITGKCNHNIICN